MWFITRQAASYYKIKTVERVWTGDSYEQGRKRLMALLRDYIDLEKESTHFMGPEGPEEFVKADIDDIKDELIVINNAHFGKVLRMNICGWKITLWSTNGVDDDKANAGYVGYL